MDKALEFIVAYLEEILEKRNKIQIFLLVLFFVVLGSIFYMGILNSQDELLSNIAEFSFYTCVIMILLGILGVGGLNKENQDMEKIEDYLNIFEKNLKENLINYYNKAERILVVYKKPRKYEINVWLNDDKYFGKIYVYFIDSELQKKALKIEGLEKDKNGYNKCLNYKENSKSNNPDDIRKQVNNLRKELEEIDK